MYLKARVQKIYKIYQPTLNPKLQKGYKMQVPKRGTMILE